MGTFLGYPLKINGWIYNNVGDGLLNGFTEKELSIFERGG